MHIKLCRLFTTDQELTESDKQTLTCSVEAFSHMSSIQAIATRLLARGVLKKDGRKEVVNSLKLHGSQEAASRSSP